MSPLRLPSFRELCETTGNTAPSQLTDNQASYATFCSSVAKDSEESESSKKPSVRRYSRSRLLSTFSRHAEAHSGQQISQPLSCNFCGKTFKKSKNLHAHQKIHDEKRERKWKCSHGNCSKAFHREIDKKRHEKVR